MLIDIEATYAIEVLWAASLLPVKLSILALYVRIFGSLRYMRVLTWVTAAYSIAWTIMAVLVLTLQCLPISKNWYMDLPGHCIDTRVFFFVGSALDLLVFFALLVLPIPPVWNLQSGFHERISVMGIFLIGSLYVLLRVQNIFEYADDGFRVFVISIVRLIELILNQSTGPDPTWSSYQVALWSTAQPCLGIVCACLPTMTPLLKTVVGRGRPKARYYDTSVAAGHVESNSKGVKDDPYSSTGNLRNPHTFPSSRDPSYGFRAERSEQIPSELADIADTELARDMRVHGNVYALTTIDVEESRK